jgi:acetoin utilization deacetylase AcuC-like enzyme
MGAGTSKDTPANQTLTLYYSPDYIASTNHFDTLQKAGWIADSLVERAIDNVTIVAPPRLTPAELRTVHRAAYVQAVESGTPRDLAASAGLGWDPGLWTSVCASNGGLVAAARTALATGTNAGSLSSGLHHARRDRGAAFCTFNGLALAARAAIDAGATRIVILDADAHAGDGTAAIVAPWREVQHLDVSIHGCGGYEPEERQRLSVVLRADAYLYYMVDAINEVRMPADLVIYNAGMDPHEDCTIGGLRGMTTEILTRRDELVFQWAALNHIPVAFALAGGYTGGRLTREALVNLHRITIQEGAAYLGPAGEELERPSR